MSPRENRPYLRSDLTEDIRHADAAKRVAPVPDMIQGYAAHHGPEQLAVPELREIVEINLIGALVRARAAIGSDRFDEIVQIQKRRTCTEKRVQKESTTRTLNDNEHHHRLKFILFQQIIRRNGDGVPVDLIR